MTELQRSLTRCHAHDGWISTVKLSANRYELTLNRNDDSVSRRITLTWPQYREAVYYWLEIDAPVLSGRPYREQRAA